MTQLASTVASQMGLLVGHPSSWKLPAGSIGNAASLLSGVGKSRRRCTSACFPITTYSTSGGIFFPRNRPRPVEFGGLRLGVHICEDAWYGEPGTVYHLKPENRRNPLAELAAAGADLFINLSASPFEIDKPHRRTQLIERHIGRHKLPFVFVNQVGGNDDLVFDGNSLVFDATGREVARLAPFASDFAICEIEPHSSLTRAIAPTPSLAVSRPRPADLLDALVLGLRDYVRKSGFHDCVLGLSGGIDSALACYIAAAAVGPKHVHGLALPSRYSSEHSVADARNLAEAIGIDFEVVPINSAFTPPTKPRP